MRLTGSQNFVCCTQTPGSTCAGQPHPGGLRKASRSNGRQARTSSSIFSASTSTATTRLSSSADLHRSSRRMRSRHDLADVRWLDAPYGLKDDPAARAQCVDFIRKNPAPFVFLAVGSPQQENDAPALRRADASASPSAPWRSPGFSLRRNKARAGMDARKPPRMAASPWLRTGARLWRRYLIDGPRICYYLAAGRQRLTDLPHSPASWQCLPVGGRCRQQAMFFYFGMQTSILSVLPQAGACVCRIAGRLRRRLAG